MFGTKPDPQPVLPPAPPTLEQTFNGASASSDYARSMFRDVVDDLTDANAALDDVEKRATSQIQSLTVLRAEATAQRQANVATISKLQELIGD